MVASLLYNLKHLFLFMFQVHYRDDNIIPGKRQHPTCGRKDYFSKYLIDFIHILNIPCYQFAKFIANIMSKSVLFSCQALAKEGELVMHKIFDRFNRYFEHNFANEGVRDAQNYLVLM